MNKVILTGYVGSVENKGNFTKVSISSKKKIKKEDVTQWFNCVAFGKIAETINKYVGVGSKILVEGELSYTTKDKIKYYDIIINNMEVLVWKKDSENKLSTPSEVEQEEYEESYLKSFNEDEIPF